MESTLRVTKTKGISLGTFRDLTGKVLEEKRPLTKGGRIE